MGKKPKESPIPPLSKAEKEERTKKFDPINEIKVSREGQPDPKPFAGGGRAMRGYGKAYMKGGRVGYAGAGLVGKGKSMGVPTPIRLSLVEQAKARLKKGKK